MEETEIIVSDELAMQAAREILGCLDQDELRTVADFLTEPAAEDRHEKLTKDEQDLLTAFRKLDSFWKENVLSYTRYLAERPPEPIPITHGQR